MPRKRTGSGIGPEYLERLGRSVESNKWVVALLLGLTVCSLPAASQRREPAGRTPSADPAVSAAGLKITLVTDRTGYNTGETVRLRISLQNTLRQPTPPLTLTGQIRYEDHKAGTLPRVDLHSNVMVGANGTLLLDYRDLWPIPEAARTGLYWVDVEVKENPGSSPWVTRRAAASFAVYRKRVRIESVELDKAFYSSGDSVRARVRVKNLTTQALSGLRVEFADRHWPWIVGRSGVVESPKGAQTKVLQDSLQLGVHQAQELEWQQTFPAPEVDQPKFHQFVATVWDHDRQQLFDIRFSPRAIVRPPGSPGPVPYHKGYMRQGEEKIDFQRARRFYPSGQISGAFAISRDRTLFQPGDTVEFRGRIRNLSSSRWSDARLEASVLSSQGKKLHEALLRSGLELEPGESGAVETSVWKIPSTAATGLYRLRFNVRNPQGVPLASVDQEIAVNRLPGSILVFCAHQDDESAHSGTIRAAVENGIPIHFVYFTSGDAGSCDRYHSRSCGPNEAREFSYVRMEEARKALAYLGVPRRNAYFLGLPDGGSGEIWYNHPDPSDPYLSVLMATSHAPFEGIHRPNLPYARRSVIDQVKGFIRRFRPEVIYTGHPDERHVDHRTNNWFVIKALNELMREKALTKMPRVRVDQVYGPRGGNKAPFRYKKHVLYVSGEASALRQEALWLYQSQGGNRWEGRRRNFADLPREEVHLEVLDWYDHEGWNEP